MTTGVVGTPQPRFGGYGRVTGHQKYLADIHVEDALHVRLVTIPCARARIVSIDASAAMEIPGVELVMTAADIPDPMPRFGPQYQDRPIIAVDEVKYHGEPVAAPTAKPAKAPHSIIPSVPMLITPARSTISSPSAASSRGRASRTAASSNASIRPPPLPPAQEPTGMTR